MSESGHLCEPKVNENQTQRFELPTWSKWCFNAKLNRHEVVSRCGEIWGRLAQARQEGADWPPGQWLCFSPISRKYRKNKGLVRDISRAHAPAWVDALETAARASGMAPRHWPGRQASRVYESWQSRWLGSLLQWLWLDSEPASHVSLRLISAAWAVSGGCQSEYLRPFGRPARRETGPQRPASDHLHFQPELGDSKLISTIRLPRPEPACGSRAVSATPCARRKPPGRHPCGPLRGCPAQHRQVIVPLAPNLQPRPSNDQSRLAYLNVPMAAWGLAYYSRTIVVFCGWRFHGKNKKFQLEKLEISKVQFIIIMFINSLPENWSREVIRFFGGFRWLGFQPPIKWYWWT